jgi:iron complex outermembrane receptor protein
VIDLLNVTGGNPDLKPEKSRSFTFGFDVKPEVAPNFSLGVDYFHIKFTDRISAPPLVGNTFLTDPVLAPFIRYNPPLADVQNYFDSPTFQGDFAGLGPAGVQAILDSRQANIAATQESGVNLAAAYELSTEFGHLKFPLTITRLLKDDFQTILSAPFVSLLNTFGEPPKWKGRSGVAWTQAGFSASLFVNYVNRYQNSLLSPAQTIGSWTTEDLYFSYKTGETVPFEFLRKLKLTLSVNNLTNKEPPYVQIPSADILPGQAPLPFDPANSSPVGRLIALQVSKGF